LGQNTRPKTLDRLPVVGIVLVIVEVPFNQIRGAEILGTRIFVMPVVTAPISKFHPGHIVVDTELGELYVTHVHDD
jgi:hypothetical protein